jgi:hypothetical protein
MNVLVYGGVEIQVRAIRPVGLDVSKNKKFHFPVEKQSTILKMSGRSLVTIQTAIAL